MALIAVLVLLAAISGSGQWAENGLRGFRDSLRTRPASGKIVIVDVDARSLARIDGWPWPRTHYAKALDALSSANAQMIAFDIDFSSRSNPLGDQALADALARAGGGTVLPTFRQTAGSGNANLIESLPAAPFRSVAMLASVNIHPETDGIVRRYPLGTRTSGIARPSLAAMLAESHGSIAGNFLIDGAIDPATVPRISFVDLIEGRVSKRQIAGKTIVIGATAIELGDRYAFASHGVIPGIVIQALAAETLIGGKVPRSYGALPALLAALAGALLILRSRTKRQIGVRGACLFLAILAAPLIVESTSGDTLEIALALIATLSAICVATGSAMTRELVKSRTIDAETGLGNVTKMSGAYRLGGARHLCAIRIQHYDYIASITDAAGRAELFRRLADRIATSTGGSRIYRVQTSALGWYADAVDTAEAFEGLSRILCTPIQIGDRRIDVRVHIGLAEIASGDVRGAVNRAALAADSAATAGLRWLQHSVGINDDRDRRMAVLNDLEGAIDAGDIWNAYQPKWDIAANKLSSVEALVRWSHPVRGIIPPDHFIPILEAEGRISNLTCHVLRAAIADLSHWDAQGLSIGVAVNLSSILLRDKAFLETVTALLTTHVDIVDRLTLEVTESAMMLDPEHSVSALEALRALGVRISIDDYGTGQSTLTYLKRLPASEIKIDKSFVQNLGASRSDNILVRSTIELAHELGLAVVAEGVETQECLEALGQMGCDYAQGWHIGKPISAKLIAETFSAEAALAA